MRYLKQGTVVDAFKIAAVGPHGVKHLVTEGANDEGGAQTHHVGGVALFDCTLDNGDVVQLHLGHTGYVQPQEGDYYLAGGGFMQKKAFEATYSAEMYAEG